MASYGFPPGAPSVKTNTTRAGGFFDDPERSATGSDSVGSNRDKHAKAGGAKHAIAPDAGRDWQPLLRTDGIKVGREIQTVQIFENVLRRNRDKRL